MTTTTLSELALRLKDGTLVPYLGPGVLSNVTETGSGESIPADSDSLIGNLAWLARRTCLFVH